MVAGGILLCGGHALGIVEAALQRDIAFEIVAHQLELPVGTGGYGAVVERDGVVAVQRVGTPDAVQLIVERQHLVVHAHLAPCGGDNLAAAEGAAVGRLLEEPHGLAGFVELVDFGVGLSHEGVGLAVVEVDIAGPLLVGGQAFAAVGIVVGVTAEVVQLRNNLFSQGDNFPEAFEVVEDMYLALNGADTGIHLGEAVHTVELLDGVVHLGEALVGASHADDRSTQLRLSHQSLGLLAQLATHLYIPSPVVQRVLVVLPQARHIDQLPKHVGLLLEGEPLQPYEAFKDDAGRVHSPLLLAAEGLGTRQLGGNQRVGMLLVTTVFTSPATHSESRYNYI